MENKRLNLIEQQVAPVVLCELLNGGVALVTINRESKLNALSTEVWTQLNSTLRQLETNPMASAVVLTGKGRAFAAGAEISGFTNLKLPRVLQRGPLENWIEVLPNFKKPVIAAVNGFALGGGCELAMMCDIIIAHKGAKFSMPEVKLGLIPGGGGTQRLPRAVGKYNAMYMILTGETVSAEQAQQMGLVSKVVEDDVVKAAVEVAKKIAAFSVPSLILAKKAVNAAFETGLTYGVQQETDLFHAAFALDDKEEGVSAFLEKRAPKFRNS